MSSTVSVWFRMHLPNIIHVQQYIGIIKDALTGTATLVAAVAAYRGFGAWRVQLIGNSSYDVGRQVLRAVSKLRNAVGAFRSRAVRGYEQAEQKEGSNFYATIFEYRWKSVGEALADFNAAIVEAEAIWGLESRNILDPLSQKVMMLAMDSQTLVQLPNNDPMWPKLNEAVLGDFTDNFGANYIKVESEIIRYIRRKMGATK